MRNEMKRYHFGFDHRVRICGQCHSWFLSEGAHSRFCAPCRAEAKRTLELPWETGPRDMMDDDDVTVTKVGEPVTG
jgi:formate-dependent nitrite reductase cytochrome c552 subunit